MMEQFGKALLNVAFAGVGAVSIAAEKASEVGKVLIARGEIAVEQGRQYSEELHQKCQEAAQKRQDERFQATVDAMTAEEREALRRRLAQLDAEEEAVRQAAQAEAETAAADSPADAPADNITHIHSDDEPQA